MGEKKRVDIGAEYAKNNEEPDLTPKQRIFIREYLANNGHGTNAALTAGYSVHSAHTTSTDLLKNPKIQKEIYRLTKQKLEKADVTFDWKVKMLKSLIENCASGNNTKDDVIHPSGVVSAIAELNKMQGHYAPEKTLTTNVNVELEEDENIDNLIDMYRRDY